MSDIIKDESGMTTKKSLNIKNLFLDPNNYRFADEVKYEKIDNDKLLSDRIQKRTRSYIEGDKRSSIHDLLESFRANGFLKVDVIQLKDLGNNNYLVIEGNRRVTALKCLQDDFKQGKDIGKLSPTIFNSVPAEIIKTQNDTKEHLIIMGLKHISGNKKWPAINQAQLIYDYLKDSWDNDNEYAEKEDELCKSLGITKQKLRSSQRAIHLINQYKESDYGDQFRTDMFSIFEEIVKKGQIREWLAWDDKKYIPEDKYKMERLFSWISKSDKIDEDNNEEQIERDPIIDKASEIRFLAEFINNEEAIDTMERAESVTIAYQKSGIDERTNIDKSLDTVQKNLKILKRYSDILEDSDLEELTSAERSINSILPQKNAINISSKNVAYYWNGGVNKHFSSLEITSYNKFSSFKLDEFKRINIFAGKNNSGKTTILEAIYLLCNQNDLSGYFDISKIRRKNNDVYADYLFESMDEDIDLKANFNNVILETKIRKYNDVEVDKSDAYLASYQAKGKIDDVEKKMIIHTYEKGNPNVKYEMIQHLCKSYFSSPYYTSSDDIMALYNNAIETKYDGKTSMGLILEFIQKIDPTINNIEPKIKNDVPIFLVDSSKFPEKTVELSRYGDGLVRIFEIALCFASCKNGVLLIDELETAIHYSMLLKYTRFIQEMAEYFNVQLFITTHSKECIDAFVKNQYNNDEISAYQVREENEQVICKHIAGENLAYLVESIAFDMRGGTRDDH